MPAPPRPDTIPCNQPPRTSLSRFWRQNHTSIMTTLRSILFLVGTVLILSLLRLGYRVLKTRRLRPLILELLEIQDMEEALQYIEGHPQLLGPRVERIARRHLTRAWGRGDAATFVSGIVRVSLLVGCRNHGVETARQVSARGFQAQFEAINSPGWQRALKLLGSMMSSREFNVHEDEVDEELVEAMDQVTALLRPLLSEGTSATLDAVVDTLRQMQARQRDG